MSNVWQGEMNVILLGSSRWQITSSAIVWVLDDLAGKGEGKSSLLYIGGPQVDYITQGEDRKILIIEK